MTAYPDAPLFDPTIVRTIFLDFDVPNWEEELELFHNTDADVPATMTVDGVTIPGVGVHFRGASSYFGVPRGTKRSLNISVDHTDPKARLGGQNTLNLLNSNGDASMMSTVLYSSLAASHLAVPRANHVQVVVNGECWGVYVNVEQFNKVFVTRCWPDFKGDGARWKVSGAPGATSGLDDRGTELAPYRERYDLKTKDREEDWDALITLCRTLSNTPIDELQAKLEPMLDLDGVLWFLALDIATANSDGYWTRASDYSLYRDPKGIFHVIPHDMNEAFKSSMGGPGGRGGPGGPGGPRGRRPGGGDGPTDGSRGPGEPGGSGPPDGARGPGGQGGPSSRSMIELDPLTGLDDATKPLRSRLLQVPALRERYIRFVKEIATQMRWKALGPVLESRRDLIKPFVERDTRKTYTTESFLRDTGSSSVQGGLRNFLEKRSAFLLAWNPSAD